MENLDTAESVSAAAQATIAQFVAARDVVIELKEKLRAEEAEATADAGRYQEAVRILAAGGGDANLTEILAAADHRKHLIAGLQILLRDQEAGFKDLEEPYRKAESRLRGGAKV